MIAASPTMVKWDWLPRAAAGLVGAYFLTAAGLKLFAGEAVSGGIGYAPALQFVAVQIEVVLGA